MVNTTIVVMAADVIVVWKGFNFKLFWISKSYVSFHQEPYIYLFLDNKLEN